MDSLRLTFRLDDLPSTQHRAGLAGLVILVRWLDARRAVEEHPRGLVRVVDCDAGGATVELNREGLAALFDVLFAASTEECAEAHPRKDANDNVIPPVRTTEVEVPSKKPGEAPKKRTLYIYHGVVPAGAMLADLDPSAEGVWVKLWRDMVWSVLRGIPTTRTPFEARAARVPIRDADETWALLTADKDPPVDLPSTYMLGAQARTAEGVPFKDRARRRFLLLFWPQVGQTYVPQKLDVQAGKLQPDGFVVAVPDVADLVAFCDDFPRALRARGTDVQAHRPREALIDLTDEAGVDFLCRMRASVGAHESPRSATVHAVDVFHVGKDGHNVRVYSMGRVAPDARVLDAYVLVQGRFWDAAFRRRVLTNALAGRPWHAGFDALASKLPYRTQGVGNWRFCRDAETMFRDRRLFMMEAESGSVSIEVLVRDMVHSYLVRRATERVGMTWEQAKDNEAARHRWIAAKQKFAKGAFLAARARRDQSGFAEFFVATVCSRGQYLPPAWFTVISAALTDATRFAETRTFTLLALAAENANSPKPTELTAAEPTEETK